MTNEQLFKLIESRAKKIYKLIDPKLSIMMAFKGRNIMLGLTFQNNDSRNDIQMTVPIIIKNKGMQHHICILASYPWRKNLVDKYNLNNTSANIPIRDVLDIPDETVHCMIFELIKAMKDPDSYIKLALMHDNLIDKSESYELLSIEADLECV